MRQFLIAFLLCCAYFAIGAEVKEVKVGGTQRAEITVLGELSPDSPNWKITNNILELSFANTRLAKEVDGKIEMEDPHSLIKRLTFYSSDDNTVKGKVVLNGSTDEIKKRIQMGRSGRNLMLAIDYPKNQSATLSLLQEEQLPLAGLSASQKTVGDKGYRNAVMMVLLVLIAVAFGAFFLMKVIKNKGGLKGTRRYLIEQLGYYPMGAKAGVSLLRIGREFVLVGVTPHSINIISNLPKLQEQYEEETGFERGVFKQAIAEEVQRLK